jgi:hypothetical protein
LAGVFTGSSAQATDRAAVHFAEPSGLAHATSFGDVLQDGFDLLGGEMGAEEDCALAFGEAVSARATAEHAAGLVGTVATGDREISRPSFAVLGALGIEATEPREVVHDVSPQEHPQDAKQVVVTPRCTARAAQTAIELGHDAKIRDRSNSRAGSEMGVKEKKNLLAPL